MEGFVYIQQKGLFKKKEKKILALMEPDCNIFMLFKHEAYEDQILNITLDSGESSQQIQEEEFTQTKLQIDPKDPLSFSIVCKKKDKEGSKSFTFRTENENERYRWV